MIVIATCMNKACDYKGKEHEYDDNYLKEGEEAPLCGNCGEELTVEQRQPDETEEVKKENQNTLYAALKKVDITSLPKEVKGAYTALDEYLKPVEDIIIDEVKK